MPLTKAQKKEALDLYKKVDVKTLDLEHENKMYVKMFRFGVYTGLQTAGEIIKAIPEEKDAESSTKVS